MKVPQFMPYVGAEEYEAIKDCFDTNWITEGPKAQLFSQKLCEIVGAKYGVFAPNGTLALYLALRAIGVGKGDEVIVPDFTFIASANAVEMAGARPVFVDVNKEDLQINIKDCKRVLTEKTKAIMPVHIFGFTSNMDEVMEFAQQNRLLVIEDAAQALGIKWKGKGCGSFGDVATFSFFADKTLTTGEGGFICTNSEETYNRLLFLRNHGRIKSGTFVHPEIGYNFRMSDIQMAIGLAQLEKFTEIKRLKQRNYNLYCELLKDLKEVEIMKPRKEVSCFISFRVVLRTIFDDCHGLINFLKENDIETRTFFYPLHKQPCYRAWNDDRNEDKHFPVSNHAFEHGVCLPSFPALSREQIEYVCSVIKKYYETRNV
jgi:perosamine synthetase